MKKVNADEPSASSEPSKLLAEIRLWTGAFVMVGLAAYVFLSFGLGWLVALGFGAGLCYAGWLVYRTLAPRSVPLAEREDLPADMELPAGTEERANPVGPPGDASTRSRIMDELVWGKADPETMAIATAIAGPGGNPIARYIELRTAQLNGDKAPEDLESAA